MRIRSFVKLQGSQNSQVMLQRRSSSRVLNMPTYESEVDPSEVHNVFGLTGRGLSR